MTEHVSPLDATSLFAHARGAGLAGNYALGRRLPADGGGVSAA
jgi:hypothetical protein